MSNECQTCVFYKRITNGSDGHEHVNDGKHGVCRRFPPSHNWQQPVVSCVGWCGEHKYLGASTKEELRP